uniref:Chitinase domain-containing protein 1 n=1 Tax=Globodera pallida TaxID=36090 RepID=A0A183BN29_GLOPA
MSCNASKVWCPNGSAQASAPKLIDGTLSKSDRKKSKSSSDQIDLASAENGQQSNKIDQDDLDLKANILADFNRLDCGKRKFTSGITLGYVTPWNNHGYDVAKWAANKFTHISPTWFQLRADGTDTKSLTCRVDGTHDIDMGWIDEILLNNSAVQIVPRFIFEGWTGAQLQHFLSEEQTQFRCVRALIDFLQRHNFNGAVMEIWLQIMSTTRGAAAEYLLELVEFWSEQFHKAGLQFILPLTPPLGANLQEIGIVNAEVVHRLLSAVDYINLMTYDFPNPEMAGVAPINWVEANLRYVINVAGGDDNWAAAKILMGLNFYGYDRGDGTNSAVLGSRYMEMLAFPDAKLSFISNIGEHQLTFGPSGKVYYPSKKSIELRLQLAETMGLGGVAIWDLGQGLDHFTTVL